MTQDAETVARLESLAVDQRYRYERGDDPHPKQLQCAEALEAGIATIRSLSTRLAAAEAENVRLGALHRKAVARNFELVANTAALTDRLRGALADVEPTFAYLDANIDLDMTDDDDPEAPSCTGLDGNLCGHNVCTNTGCVSLRLRNIRAALQPGAPDANGETK